MVKRLVVVLLLAVFGMFGLSTEHIVHAQTITEATYSVPACPGSSGVLGDISYSNNGSREMYISEGNTVFLYDMWGDIPRLKSFHRFPKPVLQIREVVHGTLEPHVTYVLYVTTEDTLYRFLFGEQWTTDWYPWGEWTDRRGFAIEAFNRYALGIAIGTDVYIIRETWHEGHNLGPSDYFGTLIPIEFPFAGRQAWDDMAYDFDILYLLSRTNGIWRYKLEDTDPDNIVAPPKVTSLGELDTFGEFAGNIRAHPESQLLVFDGGYNPSDNNNGLMLDSHDGTLMMRIPNGYDGLLEASGPVTTRTTGEVVFGSYDGMSTHRMKLPGVMPGRINGYWSDSITERVAVKTANHGLLIIGDKGEVYRKQLCMPVLTPRVYLPNIYR